MSYDTKFVTNLIVVLEFTSNEYLQSENILMTNEGNLLIDNLFWSKLSSKSKINQKEFLKEITAMTVSNA